MKKIVLAASLFFTVGCETMQPVELDLQLEALGGLVKVKPRVVVGDGKVGPTNIEVEIQQEGQEKETLVVSDED